jgi:hypothetical protein
VGFAVNAVRDKLNRSETDLENQWTTHATAQGEVFVRFHMLLSNKYVLSYTIPTFDDC